MVKLWNQPHVCMLVSVWIWPWGASAMVLLCSLPLDRLRERWPGLMMMDAGRQQARGLDTGGAAWEAAGARISLGDRAVLQPLLTRCCCAVDHGAWHIERGRGQRRACAHCIHPLADSSVQRGPRRPRHMPVTGQHQPGMHQPGSGVQRSCLALHAVPGRVGGRVAPGHA